MLYRIFRKIKMSEIFRIVFETVYLVLEVLNFGLNTTHLSLIYKELVLEFSFVFILQMNIKLI
jgi:hypothetical protein